MLMLRILTFLYGLLTVLAIGEDAKIYGLQWVHALNPLFSLCLMYFAIKTEPLNLLYIGLVGLLLAAAISGLVMNTFHWSHLIVRLVVSLLLLWFWIQLS